MHILFLSHYFPPEVNAPASRTYENAKRWIREGHRVTVITCAPNHPNGIIYSGYENRLWQWDEKDGIQILRVKTYLSANKGFVKRILNYLSYMLAATVFCLLVKKVDRVVSTSPQFFCGLAGFGVSRIHRCPWALEIRDLWPESIIAVGAIHNRGIIRFLERIENFMYHQADQIVALTKSFKEHILRRGVAESRISVITNGADLTLFQPSSKHNQVRRELGLQNEFIVSFIGTHGMAHGLETVLQTADLLRSQKDIIFLLVGDGAERSRLLQIRDARNLTNVIMLEQQPKERVPEFLAASDACMVLLKKSDLFKTVIPSKIFEAMAMARPIILGVDGESRSIIEDSGSGVFIEPENAEQLRDAVIKMRNDATWAETLGNTGAQFVRRHYDRNQLAQHYLNVLQAPEMQVRLI